MSLYLFSVSSNSADIDDFLNFYLYGVFWAIIVWCSLLPPIMELLPAPID